MKTEQVKLNKAALQANHLGTNTLLYYIYTIYYTILL